MLNPILVVVGVLVLIVLTILIVFRLGMREKTPGCSMPSGTSLAASVTRIRCDRRASREPWHR